MMKVTTPLWGWTGHTLSHPARAKHTLALKRRAGQTIRRSQRLMLGSKHCGANLKMPRINAALVAGGRSNLG